MDGMVTAMTVLLRDRAASILNYYQGRKLLLKEGKQKENR